MKRLVSTPRLWGPVKPSMTVPQVDDFFLWSVLGVEVGGRLGYVLFYKPGYFLAHPLEIFMVWQGGMAFHGGLLGVLGAMALFGYKRGWSFLSIGDFIAPLVPLVTSSILPRSCSVI
jgi:phosphatidylglycerol:prolipoprotein diacylglycerol transferase